MNIINVPQYNAVIYILYGIPVQYTYDLSNGRKPFVTVRLFVLYYVLMLMHIIMYIILYETLTYIYILYIKTIIIRSSSAFIISVIDQLLCVFFPSHQSSPYIILKYREQYCTHVHRAYFVYVFNK